MKIDEEKEKLWKLLNKIQSWCSLVERLQKQSSHNFGLALKYAKEKKHIRKRKRKVEA